MEVGGTCPTPSLTKPRKTISQQAFFSARSRVSEKTLYLSPLRSGEADLCTSVSHTHSHTHEIGCCWGDHIQVAARDGARHAHTRAPCPTTHAETRALPTRAPQYDWSGGAAARTHTSAARHTRPSTNPAYTTGQEASWQHARIELVGAGGRWGGSHATAEALGGRPRLSPGTGGEQRIGHTGGGWSGVGVGLGWGCGGYTRL